MPMPVRRHVAPGAALVAAALLAACGGSDSGAGGNSRNAPTYAVGGQIAGLDEGYVELRNGLDRKRIDANPDGLGLDAPFRFDAALPAGAGYDVQIVNDPQAQFALQCDVVNGRGTIGHAPVDSVVVRCARVKSLRLLAGVPTRPTAQDGLALQVSFGSIGGLAFDASGNLFVADGTAIRRITPLGIVTTIAGSLSFTGANDGSASEARFGVLGGVAADAAGNLLAVDAQQTIRRITAAGTVTTLAGSPGQLGSADGTGAAARFSAPKDVAFDADGNAYVTDGNSHTVRRITPAGVVTTIAGSAGVSGSADGTGSAARFAGPVGIAVDRAGNLLVADSSNHTIRRVAPGGVVTTLAGAPGVSGSADGPAATARFNGPRGIAIDEGGNVLLADGGNNVIRRLTPAGVVSTFAGSPGTFGSSDGTGAAARFLRPDALQFGLDGFLYVADANVVRRIGPGAEVSTFAGIAQFGTADGTGIDAKFEQARGVATDASGMVYVADARTVRRVTPLGVVTTLAGNADLSGAVDGSGADARFTSLQGIACDVAGNVYVTDLHAIRRITPGGAVTTLAGVVGTAGTVDGAGSAARFSFPRGLGADAASNLYVADGSFTVRRVTPSGIVTTVAGSPGVRGTADGTGAAAQFNFAGTSSRTRSGGIAVDATGTVYVADLAAVRRVATGGVVTTVATSTGNLSGVAVMPNGNLYLANFGTNVVELLLPDGAGGYRAETVVGDPTVPNTSLGPLPATVEHPEALAAFGKRVYVASGNAVVFFDR